MKPRTLVLAGALVLGGCAPDDWGPDPLAHGSGPLDDEVLEVGRASYNRYCVGCHGEDGKGEGVAARFLDPKPRDFSVGQIKFALVASGQMPNDDDYLRVINDGLMGTAMPAFPFIPDREKRALVAYVRSFYEGNKRPGAQLAIPRDPYRDKPQKGVERGEQLYHGLAACHSCHAAYATKPAIVEHMKSYELKFSSFRDNLYQSEPKDSDWGVMIKPPDFLVDRIKTGSEAEDIVRVVAAGVGGTAMPTWAQTLNAKQLWSLAYYVEHLASMRGTAEGRALKEKLLSQPEFKPPPEPEPEPEEETEGEGGGGGAGGAAAEDTAAGGGKPSKEGSAQ